MSPSDRQSAVPASNVEHARQCCAEGCRKCLRPDLLMCRKHWELVPAHLRGLIRQSIAVNALEATAQTRVVLAQLTKLAIAAVAKAEGRLPFAV